ncbi:peroxisomal coenzyme A diphosphatase NUDT7 [Elysia marginata]|uniref:Peroxisomal coenzyme A diphosphatase NUDT7 n=1 Tax=Elysia marginata TaxID=1093978 RepID=A0AAV4EAN7_9GAST|nr:peroxisomal coenzyme A diphosphatase NUDT7 [Elysia marginata]
MEHRQKFSKSNQEITEEVIRRVTAFDIGSSQEPYIDTNHRRAGVLLPIRIKDGEVFLLLTKRSKDLRTHPSAVAFPGGMRDESDQSDVDAALREAEEEIGLPPSAVRVLGVLTLGVTLPSNIVSPVVGIIPEDFVPVCNPSEVEYAFYIPLKMFVEKGNVLEERWVIKGKEHTFSTMNYTHDNHTDKIYGFTCSYCILLAAIVFGSDGNGNYWTFADEMQNRLQLYFHYITSRVESKL